MISSSGFPNDINPVTKEQVIKLLMREKRMDIIWREFPDLPEA